MPGPWNTGLKRSGRRICRESPARKHRERATIGRRKDTESSGNSAAGGGSSRRYPSGIALGNVQSISDARDPRISCEIGCRDFEQPAT